MIGNTDLLIKGPGCVPAGETTSLETGRRRRRQAAVMCPATIKWPAGAVMLAATDWLTHGRLPAVRIPAYHETAVTA